MLPFVACLVHCSRSTYGQLTLISQAPVSSPLPKAQRSDQIPSRIPPYFMSARDSRSKDVQFNIKIRQNRWQDVDKRVRSNAISLGPLEPVA